MLALKDGLRPQSFGEVKQDSGEECAESAVKIAVGVSGADCTVHAEENSGIQKESLSASVGPSRVVRPLFKELGGQTVQV